MRTPDPDLLERDRAWLARPGHRLLGWHDPDYPALLRRLPAPPAALWLVGPAEVLWTPQIAIVGSRNPTAGGSDAASDFAATLARAGFTVTSGLAEGVDAAAHAAALESGGATVAVIGTGPDRIYPARNRALAKAIIAGPGAIVGELAPGMPPSRSSFPSRNRIIAGLSLGTFVVEASLTSGALITARHATEAGREVFALPGSIHNPLARGCHRLIREGAALVESAGEIVQALAPVAAELAAALRSRLRAGASDDAEPAAGASPPPGDPDYRRLWDALGHDPVGIDVLAARTGLTVAALSSMLLLMELDGRVIAHHGRYARHDS
ncbi:MAG TPA: DNA-processing protein DprA [Xanthomonadaceae bacterium]|nr:DNA-processing protein DprA [Xanthomonadaceae bacterium]